MRRLQNLAEADILRVYFYTQRRSFYGDYHVVQSGPRGEFLPSARDLAAHRYAPKILKLQASARSPLEDPPR